MDFAEFIAPMPVDQFMAEHFGRRPAHISGGASSRGELLSLARLQELMSSLPHWTEDKLKLILNSRPVLAEHFLESTPGNATARRADPAKVQLFVEMGASLVADHIEDVDLDIRRAAAMLSQRFAATAGVNAYLSFKDVRAFNSHCDLHEVFAVQTEGEKVWRIYKNRAEAPVETIQGPNAQEIIDHAKGEVMMTVRMQPGDLLYIPRGYFHDALASSGRSLHLTFGVAPLNGRYLFRLLEEVATRDPKFRAYLPNGRTEPEALREHLASLADEVASLVRSPLVETLLTNRQGALTKPADPVDLAGQRQLDHFARTDQFCEVVWRLDGPVLRHDGGEESLGVLAEAADWLAAQKVFSEQQLQARFHWLSKEEVKRLVEIVTRTGLFVRYDAQI